jgi:phosphonate transport system substrate-binding protein
MKKSLVLILVLTMVVTAFAGCENEDDAIVYTLASLPNDGGEMTNTTKYVIEEMNKALEPYNATVKYVSADDYSVVSESILSGTAHIGTPSGATYTKAHLENPHVIPLFITAPNGVASEGGYPAYIGTHMDNKSDFEGMSEEEALQSLKGKSFSFVSATSTSGRLVPTTTLWNTFGPDGTGEITSRNQIFEIPESDGGIFSEVQFGGNHPGSVELIVNKKVYAGAFCCNYADEHADEIYIISETMVPNGPYWVNTDYMPQEHIDALINHFVALTPENAVEGLFSAVGTEDDESLSMEDRFVAVDPSFYNFLEVMYAGEE